MQGLQVTFLPTEISAVPSVCAPLPIWPVFCLLPDLGES
jgi:hypothetical protein